MAIKEFHLKKWNKKCSNREKPSELTPLGEIRDKKNSPFDLFFLEKDISLLYMHLSPILKCQTAAKEAKMWRHPYSISFSSPRSSASATSDEKGKDFTINCSLLAPPRPTFYSAANCWKKRSHAKKVVLFVQLNGFHSATFGMLWKQSKDTLQKRFLEPKRRRNGGWEGPGKSAKCGLEKIYHPSPALFCAKQKTWNFGNKSRRISTPTHDLVINILLAWKRA